jgi:hypothetical protein
LSARFTIHEGTETLAVHHCLTTGLTEFYHLDRICKTSRYFKDRLQKNRKAICPTDECCICTELLDPTLKDILFCVTCGQNFHENCIATWKQSSKATKNKKSSTTCPVCRASWKTNSSQPQVAIESELDAEAAQIYMDWMYTSTLAIPATISRKTDAFNLIILKLWAVANAFEDVVFKREVITAFFAEAIECFGNESMMWTFAERKCGDEVREFIVDNLLARKTKRWIADNLKRMPSDFTRDLRRAEVERKGRNYREGYEKVWMDRIEAEALSYES